LVVVVGSVLYDESKIVTVNSGTDGVRVASAVAIPVKIIFKTNKIKKITFFLNIHIIKSGMDI